MSCVLNTQPSAWPRENRQNPLLHGAYMLGLILPLRLPPQLPLSPTCTPSASRRNEGSGAVLCCMTLHMAQHSRHQGREIDVATTAAGFLPGGEPWCSQQKEEVGEGWTPEEVGNQVTGPGAGGSLQCGRIQRHRRHPDAHGRVVPACPSHL